MTRRRRLLALAAVLAVAAFFRLYRLDAIPPGLFFDEAQDGVDAAAIARGERWPLMVEISPDVKGRTREPLYFYLAAGAFAVAGPSVTALRLTSALIGIATVAALLLAAARLVGPRPAVVGALLLAVNQWHVTFSRIGLRAILTELWIGLTVLAVHRAVARRTRASAALAGVTVGLGFYTYFAYWVVPLALLAVFGLHRWQSRGARRADDARLAANAGAAFLVVAAPLLAYAVAKPDYLFARALEVAGSGHPAWSQWQVWRDNLQQVFFLFHFRSRCPAQFGIENAPLLDPITGVALALGVFVLCRRLPAAPVINGGLLAFFLVPLLPGALGDMPGAVLRTQGALPAACLIAALGLDAVAGWIAGAGIAWRRYAASALLAAAVAATALLNFRAYFFDWAERPETAAAYATDVRRFFDFVAGLAPEADVYLSPYVYRSPNLLFLNAERRLPLRPLTGAGDLVGGDGTRRDRVVVSESRPLNALIEEAYLSAQVVGRYAVHGRSDGRVYRIAAGDLRPQLSAAHAAEAEHWVEKMQDDFRAQTRRW